MGHFPIKKCCGAYPCSFNTQIDNIYLDQYIHFHFGHVQMGTIQAILERRLYIYTYAMQLEPLLLVNILTMLIMTLVQTFSNFV